MTEFAPTLQTPKTPADYKAALNRLLEEMTRLEAQMQQDRAEIKRLRAESQVISRHTDSVLERLDKQLQTLARAAQRDVEATAGFRQTPRCPDNSDTDTSEMTPA